MPTGADGCMSLIILKTQCFVDVVHAAKNGQELLHESDTVTRLGSKQRVVPYLGTRGVTELSKTMKSRVAQQILCSKRNNTSINSKKIPECCEEAVLSNL
jgi:hypothetical protein